MRTLHHLGALGAVVLLLGQAPSGQAPARDAAARKTGTGVIRGRVVVAGSTPRLGIPSVRISISGGAGPINPVFTDADGGFEIAALLAGRYMLTAEKTGFARTRYGALNELDAPVPIDVTDVSNGATASGVEIEMPKGASITGRIVDELGDPVVGALVTVGHLQIAGRETTVVAATSRLGWNTDDRGEYRIGGLSAGKYVLQVYGANEGSPISGPPEWGHAIGWVKTYYQDATALSLATPITLRAGEERAAADFALVPSKPAKLTITLTDTSGAPMSGVVLLTQYGISGVSSSTAALSPASNKTTMTLQAGEWTAMLIGAGAGRALAHVTLASGEEAALAVVAGPGARMSGRVVFSGSSPPPAPASIGLRVRGVGPDAKSPYSNNVTPVSADGTFDVTGLLGAVILEPASPIPGWSLQAMRIGSRDLLDEPLLLTGSENVTDVELVFTDQLAELSGTTVDAQGGAVPGCPVNVMPESGELRSDSDRARLLRSNQSGRFVIGDLRPGRYLVAATANMDLTSWLSPDSRDRLRPSATIVTLADHDRRTETLVCASLR